MNARQHTPIESLLTAHPQLWRGEQLARASSHHVSSGFTVLDNELPGNGWPSNTLTELLLRSNGIGELRFVMPALLKLSQAKKQIILLAPPHTPFVPAFAQFGITSERLLLVHTANASDRLWAVEHVLKSNQFGALLVWLPEDKKLARNDQLRRLQMAAHAAQGLSFVFRPSHAQHTASPASLRLQLSAAGPSSLRLEILKRRGPVMGQPMLIDLPQPRAWLPSAYFAAHHNEMVSHLPARAYEQQLQRTNPIHH